MTTITEQFTIEAGHASFENTVAISKRDGTLKLTRRLASVLGDGRLYLVKIDRTWQSTVRLKANGADEYIYTRSAHYTPASEPQP
jgi:hypothetical protein